jgi:hypothetical protein
MIQSLISSEAGHFIMIQSLINSEARHFIMIQSLISSEAGHFIMIQSLISSEAANVNLIVFCLPQPGLDSTIYHTPGDHTNTTTLQVTILTLPHSRWPY